MMSTINPAQAGGRVHPRRTRQLILVGLILLLALAVAAATLHSVTGRDDTMTLTAAGIRELVVKVYAGRIELTPSPTGTVQVTTTRRWSLRTPQPPTQAGGVLTLTGGCPPLGTLGITCCAVDERVTVPAGTHVQVTTSTGDLTGTDLTVASLEANTSRGSITASFAQPPDRILARLDAGGVRLTVPATTYAVEATTHLMPGTSPWTSQPTPTRPRKISAHISRGNIHILQR
jgi:hypothetical protein